MLFSKLWLLVRLHQGVLYFQYVTAVSRYTLNHNLIYALQQIMASTVLIVIKLRTSKLYYRDFLWQISRKSVKNCEHCSYRVIEAFSKIWLSHNIRLLDKFCQELPCRISSKLEHNLQILTQGQEHADARRLHTRRSTSLRKKCLESKIPVWNT